ncbi:hypothetical protein HPS36_05675 [Halorubrum salinarum]|uniref:DUF7310 domain-containing protein n=1 Tax=Halorubrum salinarum TaxID=2739057 RepID=A0A7D4BPK3_9EURY|nr:hypothetical protein [Halorubrum salinarum]QKG92357.1 hypothetical protein HPS36_05675 [Halorubrum salinarum]
MTDHARGTEPPRAETESEAATPTDANGPNDRIESRLRAVERAVTGGDARPADAATEARATAERERLESRLDDVEERVAELEAATQAIRGYAGAVRAVNDEVERRADLALARATEASRGADRDADRDDELDQDATDAGPADGAVPSESALDAALPDDGPGSGPRTGGEGSIEGGGGASDDGGAWATDALDRLRESL